MLNTWGSVSFRPCDNSVKEICPFYRGTQKPSGNVLSQTEQSLFDAKFVYFKHWVVSPSPYSTPGLWLLTLGKWERGSVALAVTTEEQIWNVEGITLRES